MSVSKKVKLEIIKKNPHKKETKALVQGLFLAAGSLIISGGNLSFVVSNELEEVVTFLKSKLESLFDGIEVDIVKVMKNFKNKERFELFVDETNNERVLKELGIISYDKEGCLDISSLCDKSYLQNNDKMLAFLTGVFLGSGSLSVPCETTEKKRYGYHFEIDMIVKEQADLIAEILSNFDIFPKIVERNETYVVYLKNSDTICDVLSLFGANKVVLDLLNQRVSRDVSNNTNRQINCISANIDKTVNAALKQLKAIEVIQNTIGLENLPDTLSEAALLRLGNPEASLKDLLSLMEVKVSKGALAQRFDKIIKLAEELGENDAK
ncbi:MAG: DNA-binding protein WhiA [Clostridia bacterium]|nr:DNA-binding protein WhiA [Clostridia bacterium]